MKFLGRERSPSLRKMEITHPSGRKFGGSTSSFNINNIFGDPFSMATLGVAVGGWLMAFISCIIADIKEPFPNFVWWSLVYTFFCIIGIFITFATDSVFTYHVAMTGFLSAGMVFTTSAVNSLIYSDDGAKEAGAAGFILLSMISILWIFYFGSQPQASHRQTIDSFALHKDNPAGRTSRHMSQQPFRPDTMHSTNQAPQMYNSAQLAGFENSSPVINQSTNQYTEAKRDTTLSSFQNPSHQPPVMNQPPSQNPIQTTSAFNSVNSPQQHIQQQTQLPPSTVGTGTGAEQSSLSQPAEYPYRAKAIYSYEANPDDPNEISFNKHEVLEVSDVSGRWWQAKKTNGETGIAPSNYLILL